MDPGPSAGGDLPTPGSESVGGDGVAAAETARLVMAGARPSCTRTRRARSGVVEEGDMAAGKSIAAASGGWIVFEDEAGFSMTPPRVRTWGRRGLTPVVRVRGRSRRRTSVAALCCYKPDENARLIYRPRHHLLLKGARKSFSWQDHRDLLVRDHIQLGAPIVVVWDIFNTHLATGLRKYEAEHDWLTTIRLPPYAPALNPVEAIRSLVRRATANTALDTPPRPRPHTPQRVTQANSDPTLKTSVAGFLGTCR